MFFISFYCIWVSNSKYRTTSKKNTTCCHFNLFSYLIKIKNIKDFSHTESLANEITKHLFIIILFFEKQIKSYFFLENNSLIQVKMEGFLDNRWRKFSAQCNVLWLHIMKSKQLYETNLVCYIHCKVSP
jgi:hypothetical protein